jgi:hypothetical protein
VRVEGDRSYVLVVNGDQVARREVVAGFTDEVRSLTEIKEGLTAGEIAIVGPAEGLKVGERVQVVSQEG